MYIGNAGGCCRRRPKPSIASREPDLTLGSNRHHSAETMRLIHKLAAWRILYRRPIVTMPDILVIDIPARYSAPSLPLGRYYPIILETLSELNEIQAFLAAEQPFPVVPDLFDRCPSALDASDITFCRYAPPNPDWPILLLCHWPLEFTAMVPPASNAFARGCHRDVRQFHRPRSR